MWNICPVLFTMILSLCLSPIPSMYVATQYPAHDSVKFSTAYKEDFSISFKWELSTH